MSSEDYISAAFRSSVINEAYIFMKKEYVIVDYKNDRRLIGPLFISDGFPSLAGTEFAEYKIDCAFPSSSLDEVYIFFGNLCALFNYAPGTTDDCIVKGPMSITTMFPFLTDTVFETGIDAAFEVTNEVVYLFKDNNNARVNIQDGSITGGFPSPRNTIFKTGVDAAFASHVHNEAYLFKRDSFALIAPGNSDDYILGGVQQIKHNWSSLHDLLPCTCMF